MSVEYEKVVALVVSLQDSYCDLFVLTIQILPSGQSRTVKDVQLFFPLNLERRNNLALGACNNIVF